jgi:hypothetical protein
MGGKNQMQNFAGVLQHFQLHTWLHVKTFRPERLGGLAQ